MQPVRRRQFDKPCLPILMAVSLSLLTLVACGDSTELSEPTAEGRDATHMPLEEYASLCAQYADDEIPEGATSGEVSEDLARSIELMGIHQPTTRSRRLSQ